MLRWGGFNFYVCAPWLILGWRNSDERVKNWGSSALNELGYKWCLPAHMLLKYGRLWTGGCMDQQKLLCCCCCGKHTHIHMHTGIMASALWAAPTKKEPGLQGCELMYIWQFLKRHSQIEANRTIHIIQCHIVSNADVWVRLCGWYVVLQGIFCYKDAFLAVASDSWEPHLFLVIHWERERYLLHSAILLLSRALYRARNMDQCRDRFDICREQRVDQSEADSSGLQVTKERKYVSLQHSRTQLRA